MLSEECSLLRPAQHRSAVIPWTPICVLWQNGDKQGVLTQWSSLTPGFLGTNSIRLQSCRVLKVQWLLLSVASWVWCRRGWVLILLECSVLWRGCSDCSGVMMTGNSELGSEGQRRWKTCSLGHSNPRVCRRVWDEIDISPQHVFVIRKNPFFSLPPNTEPQFLIPLPDCLFCAYWSSNRAMVKVGQERL